MSLTILFRMAVVYISMCCICMTCLMVYTGETKKINDIYFKAVYPSGEYYAVMAVSLWDHQIPHNLTTTFKAVKGGLWCWVCATLDAPLRLTEITYQSCFEFPFCVHLIYSFGEMLNPSYIILRIQRLESKPCRCR